MSASTHCPKYFIFFFFFLKIRGNRKGIGINAYFDDLKCIYLCHCFVGINTSDSTK